MTWHLCEICRQRGGRASFGKWWRTQRIGRTGVLLDPVTFDLVRTWHNRIYAEMWSDHQDRLITNMKEEKPDGET